MTTDICLKYQLLNAFVVQPQQPPIYNVLCIRSTYTAISLGKQLQTHACCPTCTRNAECPVTGIFRSTRERPNSVPVIFNRKQDQYLVLLKVLCILSAVQSLGSTFHSLIHTPRIVITEQWFAELHPLLLIQLDRLKYTANMQWYYLYLKANTRFSPLTLVLPCLLASHGAQASDESSKGESENEAFDPHAVVKVLFCYWE